MALTTAACSAAPAEVTNTEPADTTPEASTTSTSSTTAPNTSLDGTTTTNQPSGVQDLSTTDCSAAVWVFSDRPEDKWPDGSSIKTPVDYPDFRWGLTDGDFAGVDTDDVEVMKYVLEVNGSVSPVQITVSPEDQGWARLFYQGPDGPWHIPFEEALVTIDFEACDDKDTQFGGGLVLLATGCLDLIVDPAEAPEYTHTIPVGDDTTC